MRRRTRRGARCEAAVRAEGNGREAEDFFARQGNRGGFFRRASPRGRGRPARRLSALRGGGRPASGTRGEAAREKNAEKGEALCPAQPLSFFFLFICVICDRRSQRCGTAERRIAAAREERGRALRGTRQFCGGGARRLCRFAGISYGGGREIRKVCTARCGFLYKGKNGGMPGGTGRTRASAGMVRPAELTVFLQSRRKKYIFPCLNFTLVPYTVITETKLDI